LVWALIVILQGTDIEPDRVFFSDLKTCIDYKKLVVDQNITQRVAGDKIYIKAYCVPQKNK
tara:strand:+ start:623 stop:805 length:183 start_codon:yes stop_codon:yes gene_type:complete